MRFEEVEKQAKANLEKDGYLQSIVILYQIAKKGEKANVFITPLIFKTDEEKENCKKAMRMFVQKMNIGRYIVAMEGWVSNNPYINLPRDDINRKEAIVISEYSKSNIYGRTVIQVFSRKDKKIIWGKRLEHSKQSEDKSSFNFFLEDLTDDEYNENRKKVIIADMTKRFENADLTDDIKLLKKKFKEDFGVECLYSDDEIKNIILSIVKKGKFTFKNGVIPEKFRLPKDDLIDKKEE